jgi:hypothetical protein
MPEHTKRERPERHGWIPVGSAMNASRGHKSCFLPAVALEVSLWWNFYQVIWQSQNLVHSILYSFYKGKNIVTVFIMFSLDTEHVISIYSHIYISKFLISQSEFYSQSLPENGALTTLLFCETLQSLERIFSLYTLILPKSTIQSHMDPI